MNHSVTGGRGSASRIRGRVKAGMFCSLTVLAAPAASTCGGPPPPDITGTWATKVQSPGSLGLLALGTLPVNIQATIRLVITKPGADYSEKIEICKLAIPTVPPETLVTTFRPALLQTLVGTAPFSATPTIGGPLPLPLQTIQTGSSIACHGSCAPGDFVDSDNDGKPGDTIPTTIGPPINQSPDAYVALTVPVALSAGILTDANTINGNGVFSAAGQFHSLSTGPASGPIDVTTSTPEIPVTIKKMGTGDVSCSTVVQQLP
jgi:hypothetical protein